jgi:ABC-type transporter MlaC component
MTAPTAAARILRTAFDPRAFVLAVLLLGLAFSAAPVRAASAEESYVTQLTNQAVKILTDKTLDQKGRYNSFHTLILTNIDLDRIAAFALGRYAGAMRASGRYDEYKSYFGDYIARIYASRLSGYSGEVLKVQKSMLHGTTDVIVFSVIEPGNAGGDPIPVNWRLTKKDNGGFLILDVQIIGAWMSIEQQSQFSSIIANNNRDVTKLIDYLKEQTSAPLPDKA